MYRHLFASPRCAARMLSTLTLATLVSLSACGDSGPSTTSDEGTSEADSDDSGETTEADATTTGDGTTTAADGSSSGGPVLLCDGSTVENLFDCEPCTDCGTWDDASIGDSYPAGVQCMLEGMRDQALVSSSKVACTMGKCTANRFAVTMEGTVLNQLAVYDEGMQPSNYFTSVEYTIKDADYFDTCLQATEQADIQACASPSNWFVEQINELESLVCP